MHMYFFLKNASLCIFIYDVLIFFIVIHYTCSFLFVVVDLTLSDEQILNENQPDMEDFISLENQDEEAIVMGEESSSGI